MDTEDHGKSASGWDAESIKKAILEALSSKPDRKPIEITDYGEGKWFWPKSWECNNPGGPIASLSLEEEYLLDKMTGLVSVKRNWCICTSLPYLVRACHAKRSRRAIWEDLSNLDSRGFVKKVETGKKREALFFLVNPIMMATERASSYSNYNLAKRLVIEPAKPKPPKTPRKKKAPLSREEQLAWFHNQQTQAAQ